MPVECPAVESSTEPPPPKPQPIVVKKTSLNSPTNQAEQSPHPPPSPQLPPISSSAPATVLTSPTPLTPAPRRRNCLKIKKSSDVSNLPPPPPLKPAPGLFATSSESRRKSLKKKVETKKKWSKIDHSEVIDEQDTGLESFIRFN